MAASAAALISGCSGSGAEANAPPRAVMAVELATPATAVWPESIEASGGIAAWHEAIVGAEVSGVRLDQVLVEVGDVVAKGQLLARYNEDNLKAELTRLDANVAEAEANLAKAQSDASRADRLEESGAMAKQLIESYRTQAAVARAQLASIKALRNAQSLKLRNARVVAPDDGVISSRTATVGSVGAPGAELFRLVRGGRLEWRAEVPSDAMERLQLNQAAEVRKRDGTSVAGKLRKLAPTIDARTQSGIAYVDLPVKTGLSAGMYVSGRFSLPGREALLVPESAVVLRDGNRYLMRIDAQNHVHQVKVIVGRRHEGAIEILQGVKPGDRFVNSGADFLGDGDLVDVRAGPSSS
ncbi:MAG TPA: efflux RND transporter periplasmic adaptor subunit [Solimonas sp.]|nr:efflux RND transporter periplasmic adaptor subunit [Solimonas sp.]